MVEPAGSVLAQLILLQDERLKIYFEEVLFRKGILNIFPVVCCQQQVGSSVE